MNIGRSRLLRQCIFENIGFPIVQTSRNGLITNRIKRRCIRVAHLIRIAARSGIRRAFFGRYRQHPVGQLDIGKLQWTAARIGHAHPVAPLADRIKADTQQLVANAPDGCFHVARWVGQLGSYSETAGVTDAALIGGFIADFGRAFGEDAADRRAFQKL